MEEILAEAPGGDVGAQFAVGGGDHPDVDPQAPVAADPFDLAFLEHAQELGLHVRRHVADLVEEERAAVGLLELARAGCAARR